MTTLRILNPDGYLLGVGLKDLSLSSIEPVLCGALPLGTAVYPLPSNTIYVSTTGSDANAGSLALPKRTLAAAIAQAPNNGTIAIRGGEYRENAGSTTKRLTIQNYPGEVVWFDGTDVETSWTLDTGRWRAPLTVEFEHTMGHDGGATASRFVDNAKNPMAAWPDMVFIDGVRQWQVASNPAAGEFSVDYTGNFVWIGTNPAGKEVRVTKRNRFLIVNAACKIRGIGFRRYATELAYAASTLQCGAASAGTVIENVHAWDCAIQAIGINGNDSVVQDCTIVRPGQTGIHSNQASGCVIQRNHIVGHNWERFKTQPHCGGMKITKSDDLTIDSNYIDGGAFGDAAGVWLDDCVWDVRITNNFTIRGDGGIFAEASGEVVIAGNRCIGHVGSYFGIRLTISQQCYVWNNYCNVADGYLFAAWQDDREATPSAKYYDRGLRWHVADNVFNNNVFGGTHTLYAWYLRKDTNAPASVNYANMIDEMRGNVFASAPGQNPPVSVPRLAGLEPGTGVVNYSNLTAFQNAAPYASANQMTSIQNPTDADMAAITGVTVPDRITTAMGVPTGLTRVGPPRPAPVPREVIAA